MTNTMKVQDSKELPVSLGVCKESRGIRFTVASAEKDVSLILYDRESGKEAARFSLPAEPSEGRIRSIVIGGLDWRKYRYNYQIRDQIVQDPYATALTEMDGVCQCEMSFGVFSWGESKHPGISLEQGILYHLHVRNYTMQEGSGVRHRGTFRGLQEKLPYLKKLGVNQLLLMPVYEFEEDTNPGLLKKGKKDPIQPVVHKNYWGYKSGFYFAPKRRYTAGEDPVREFKAMVRAYHEQGIEILLEFYFEAETPLQLQIDCLRHWVREYQVDGFRIMGNTELVRYLTQDDFFADTKILAPYLGEIAYSEDAARVRCTAEIHDGFMNDVRRILKGDEGMLEAFVYRTRRNPKEYAAVNYIAGHDGFTLRDLVSYDRKHNEENGEQNNDGPKWNYSWNCGAEGETRKKDVLSLRARQQKNALMMLFFSQGTPMLLAGDEFGNSQRGNNNPYCLDNEVSWVDWTAAKKVQNRRQLDFVRSLIALRKSEKLFQRREEMVMSDTRACGYPDLSYHGSKAWYADYDYENRQIGMLYSRSYVKEDGFLYVCYNLHPEKQPLALPKLPEGYHWEIAIDTFQTESILEKPQKCKRNQKILEMPPRTIRVLYGKKDK